MLVITSIIGTTESSYDFIIKYGSENNEFKYTFTISQGCDDKFGHSVCLYTFISIAIVRSVTIIITPFQVVWLVIMVVIKLQKLDSPQQLESSKIIKKIRMNSGNFFFVFLFVTVANNFIITALLLSRSFYVTQGAASLVLISLARLIDIFFSKKEVQAKSLVSSILNSSAP